MCLIWLSCVSHNKQKMFCSRVSEYVIFWKEQISHHSFLFSFLHSKIPLLILVSLLPPIFPFHLFSLPSDSRSTLLPCVPTSIHYWSLPTFQPSSHLTALQPNKCTCDASQLHQYYILRPVSLITYQTCHEKQSFRKCEIALKCLKRSRSTNCSHRDVQTTFNCFPDTTNYI